MHNMIKTIQTLKTNQTNQSYNEKETSIELNITCT